jgi:glycosyltransferase involved in cell wall biosynthesis
MNKQYCVISCPIDTYSGYGARSRDFVKAIYELKKDEWQIEIIPQRWGSTPWNYIKDNSKDWNFLEPLINKTGQLTKQPDVWIQITIPNEFQQVGKFNIGVTAGIETTICDPSWIEGCNRMNLILASSNHAKQVFQTSAFDQKDQTGRVVKHIKLEKPVEVLFEGVDLNKYFLIEEKDYPKNSLIESLDSIKESFCYLFVGHWLQGDMGEDRKNVNLMIKTFLETYKGKKSKPALVLKTSSAGSSIMDRDSLLEKIDSIRNSVGSTDLPNIYLLHGELEDIDINYLYNHSKIKAMINLTKGEGFGRPLLEFSVCKKPIIVSNWSGHIDFLDKEFCCLINGEIKQVHPSAVVQNMIIPESGWFSPNISETKQFLKDVFENYEKYLENAKRQAYKSKTQFSFDSMKDSLLKYLELIPKQAQLKLPTLKKIELPTLKKI